MCVSCCTHRMINIKRIFYFNCVTGVCGLIYRLYITLTQPCTADLFLIIIRIIQIYNHFIRYINQINNSSLTFFIKSNHSGIIVRCQVSCSHCDMSVVSSCHRQVSGITSRQSISLTVLGNRSHTKLFLRNSRNLRNLLSVQSSCHL